MRTRWLQISCAGAVPRRRVTTSCLQGNHLVRNLHTTVVCRNEKHPDDQTAARPINSAAFAVNGEEAVSQTEEASTQRHQSSTTRAMDNVVQPWNTATREAFEDAVLSEFPGLPREELPRLLAKALRRGNIGRVMGREDAEKASLAVRAHIRHKHTDYEQILKERARPSDDGAMRATERDWEEARSMIHMEVDALAATWGRGVPHLFSPETYPAVSRARTPAEVPAWALPNSSSRNVARRTRPSFPTQQPPSPLTSAPHDLAATARTEPASAKSASTVALPPTPASLGDTGLPAVPSPRGSARQRWEALKAWQSQKSGPS